MNLQYSPFLWISSRETLKDFAAASADIRTLRHINESWHWTLGDRLRYSPTHSTEETTGFVADPGGRFFNWQRLFIKWTEHSGKWHCGYAH